MYSLGIQDASDKSLIHGIKVPNNGPTISHLFYTNNAIFVSMWDKSSIKNLSRTLKGFEISYGLKVNFHISILFGICTTKIELQYMAQILGCLKIVFHFLTSGCLLVRICCQKIIRYPLLININRNYQTRRQTHCHLWDD